MPIAGVEQHLPKGNENVGKSLDASEYRKDNPVHHPFDLKIKAAF